MGLDMYLTAKRYLSKYDDKDKALKQKIQELLNVDFEAQYVDLSVGYWRKANQIHKWFVETVQDGEDDCGDYYVTEEQLKELLELVNKVLGGAKPEDLLPTESGFFFGSTEYDEYYKQDLVETKEIIEKWLAFSGKGDYELYYHSSW